MARYTPSKPNPEAISRVPHPLPIPEKCNHCGGDVFWTDNSSVYGRSFGKWPYIYKCQDCEARVGMHPETGIPLGTLANAEEREARKLAKACFYSWMEEMGYERRSEAYKRLGQDLSIEPQNCHFGMFDVATCDRVVAYCSGNGATDHVVSDSSN